MPLDVSLEAIEADLMRAEGSGSTAAIAVHLARAQVRATLLAAQPAPHEGRHEAAPTPVWVNDSGQDILVAQGIDSDVYTVPKSSPWEDRVEAAALLLGVETDRLAAGLATVLFPPAQPDEHDEATRAEAVLETEEARDEANDIDADFFAEAKAERKARRK